MTPSFNSWRWNFEDELLEVEGEAIIRKEINRFIKDPQLFVKNVIDNAIFTACKEKTK